MKEQYIKAVFLIGIIILAGIFFTDSRLTGMNSESHDIRFGYPVVHSTLTEDIEFYEFSSFNEHLEISEINKINQKVADQLVQEKVMLFSSLFNRQRVGYKGQHTEFIECPGAYKPEYHESFGKAGHLQYFTGFANDRYVFGSCDSESAQYLAVNAYLYCSEAERLLDIRYFIAYEPARSVQHFIEKLSCENIEK